MKKQIKIVDKYITKQLLETFLLGVVIFTSLMFASDTFITLVKQISLYGISFQVAILAVILNIPSILVLTIPMGVLLSTVMTFNKLSLNSEITVMRACGISITRLARPVLVFGLAAAVASFFINECVAPAANMQAKKLTVWALSQKNVPNGKTSFSFKELQAGNQLKRLFYIDSCEKNILKGITVLDVSKNNTVQIIQSKFGSTSPEYWSFNEGAIYTISATGKVLNTTLFDNLKLKNTFNVLDAIKNNKAGELNFFGLLKYIYRHKNDLNNLTSLKIALHEKISIPITALILALIGVPLAITPPRARFNRGFLFSILIIFCYYLLKAFSVSLGEAGVFAPVLSAWLPNLIIGSVGAVLFYRKAYFT